MLRTISLIQKHLEWSIFISMIVGLAIGYFFDLSYLRVLIIPLTILMVFPVMVTLKYKSLFLKCNLKLQLTAMVMNFLIIPAIAYAIVLVSFSEMRFIGFGLLLISLFPTSGMTVSWTKFSKGNVNVAVKMTLIGIVLGSLIAPIYLKNLIGRSVGFDLARLFNQIIIVVFIPLIIGIFTKRILINRYGNKAFEEHIKPKFPIISSIGVILIIFVAVALRSRFILSNPGVILRLLLPLLVYYFLNYSIATLIGKFFFDRGDAIALVFGTVMRNLSVALAVTLTAFGDNGPEIALIIAVAYIIQVKSAAWYVKFAEKIFPIPSSA